MRPEKKYLVNEAKDYLSRSDYFFLTDYKGINSEETSNLRNSLAEKGAEFHVVKNSSLRLAAPETVVSELNDELQGHTAIVIGGEDPSGVAKALGEYFKDTQKVSIKGGSLDNRVLSVDDIKILSKLPGLESLRGQLLSLLNTPATKLVTVFSEPARGMVTVLKAKTEN